MKDKGLRETVDIIKFWLKGNALLNHDGTIASGELPSYSLIGRVCELENQRADLYKRVMAFEARPIPVEKDCPVCGHVTLMREAFQCTPYWISMEWPPDAFRVPRQFYCYTCGKTFKEQNGLVEV